MRLVGFREVTKASDGKYGKFSEFQETEAQDGIPG